MLSMETELMNHLERLSVGIGPRPLGTEGNHAAAAHIREAFQKAGLAVEEQRFDCPAWAEEETRLQLEDETLMAAANAFSPSCDVSAPAVALGTVAELEDADLRGRIGILYGDLTSGPLIPKAFTLYSSERDQRIIRLLEEKQPAALVTVNPLRECLTSLIEDWNLDIPSATVPAEVGLALLERIGRPLRLRITTTRKPGHSANVIGKAMVARPERIVLCAHYDTKFGTPGALDNGSGVAALLTLAGALARSGLSTGLECVAFSDHEYLCLGSTEYAAKSGHEFGGIIAAINMDGIGLRIGTNTVAVMSASAAFQAEVDEVVKEHPGVAWTDPWPQSDHSTFAWRGVPSVAITSGGATNISHVPADTIEWVGADKAGEVVSVVMGIVQRLQDKPLDWAREAGEAGTEGT